MEENRQGTSPGELASMGVSEAERVVYEVLVERGSGTAADLRGVIPGSSARIARVLRNLEAKGLVSRGAGRPVRYAAVPPEVGLELLLAHRHEELRSARRAVLDLTERFHEARARREVSGLIEIVSGERAVRERYGGVSRTAREELRAMSRPPYVVSPKQNRADTAELHRKQVRVRNILDPRYFESDPEKTGGLDHIREDLARGEQYRVMPRTPLKLIVADDRAALIPLQVHHTGEIQSAALFHASALLEALIEVFETCWSLAYPLDGLGSGEDDPGWRGQSVSAEDRELLALLAAGIPDDAMARRLGVSYATVQRRVHALKARLGATTRFQAGLQAAQRGWISGTDPDRG